MILKEALKRLTPQYLAGLIDGEGCIAINKTKRSFRGRLVIEMTSKFALEALAVRYGILFQHVKSRKGVHNNKAAFRIELTGERALKALLEVRPHLVDKADQADIVIKFLRHRGRMQLIAGNIRAPLSQDSRNLYDTMVKELRRLKTHSYEDS